MLQLTHTYRRLSAYLLAGWMCAIIVSGVVFMHKEVTSTGEIVTHVHPYDFTNKHQKHHHKSDAEIQYLNIVFQGSFLETDFVQFEAPFFQTFELTCIQLDFLHSYSADSQYYFLRGPPANV